MTIEVLLREAGAAGLDLWLEDGELRYRMPGGERAAKLMSAVRAQKADVIGALRSGEQAVERIARVKLNLRSRDLHENCFPLGIEQIWRNESRRNGIAPRIPFDITRTAIFGTGVRIPLLERSIARIAERHSALCSRVDIGTGRPLQERMAFSNAQVVVHRLSSSIQGAGLEQAVRQVTQVKLDLLAEPGFKCNIFIDADQVTGLAITLHHYFGDFWSSQIIKHELMTCYKALLKGEEPKLRNVPAQYCDYAVAQRKLLAAKLPAHLAYWRGQLEDAAPFALPTDSPGRSYEMEQLAFTLHSGLMPRIAELAKGWKVPASAIAMAAYQIMLANWSGRDHVMHAFVAADRVDPRFIDTIGYMITGLPIGAVVDRSRHVSDFIQQVADAANAAFEYRHLSYELYEEIFSPPQPFCNSLFNYISRMQPAAGQTGAPPGPIAIDVGHRFPRMPLHREMLFELVDGDGNTTGRVYYDTGTFRRATIQWFIREFQAVLSRIVDRPTGRIGDLVDADQLAVATS